MANIKTALETVNREDRTATAYEWAKAVIRGLPTTELIEVWERTATLEGAEIPMVRGWIMDEVEDRYPKAFAAWIDTEYCRDEELKDYIRRIQA